MTARGERPLTCNLLFGRCCPSGRVAVEVTDGSIVSIKPERLSTANVFECAQCLQQLPSVKFAKSQMKKKKSERRCNLCTAAGNDPIDAARAEMKAECEQVMRDPESSRVERDIVSMLLATEKLKEQARMAATASSDMPDASDRGGLVQALWNSGVMQHESNVRGRERLGLSPDPGGESRAVEAASKAILLEQSAIPHQMPVPANHTPGRPPSLDGNIAYPRPTATTQPMRNLLWYLVTLLWLEMAGNPISPRRCVTPRPQ